TRRGGHGLGRRWGGIDACRSKGTIQPGSKGDRRVRSDAPVCRASSADARCDPGSCERSLDVAANAAWKFTQVWVLLALGLFGIAFLIGAVYLSGVGIQLARAAEASDADGALVRLISRWLVGYGLVLVTLLVAAWDMVFKPGLW